jgi:capsular polysaccharide biosynthesis protein
MNYPSWVAAFLKQAFAPVRASANRRLWIGRTGRRRGITNAVEVDSVMRQHGFEAYDVAAAANPAEDFAAAAVVVSPHGGVLADLVFCNPGTKVLELLPTDHAGPYYYTLSLAAGLDYRCLACRSLEERPDGGRRPSTVDFTVDIGDLVAAIADMAS